MDILKFLLIFVSAFIFTSFIDFVWHLVIWKKAYLKDFSLVARIENGKQKMKPLPGLISQVLVVSSMMFLVLNNPGDIWHAVLNGSVAGVLAISVYGLVNEAIINKWSTRLTLLEVVWGPIIGGLSGAFIWWLSTVIL